MNMFIKIWFLRYSDFLVNEIDKNGAVIHLTDLNPPKAAESAELSEVKCKDFLNYSLK